MPGIVGLVTRMPREWAEPQLLRMVKALRHEPSYTSGTWIDEPSGIYVGWIARENSFSDAMPLRSCAGNVVLTFSGEEFPEPGTSRRLQRQGPGQAAHGASYLVGLYEEDQIGGPMGCLSRPLPLQTARSSGFRELLSGKCQDDITGAAAERHRVRERILPRYPAYVNPRWLIDPGSRSIRRLMTQSLYHAQ